MSNYIICIQWDRLRLTDTVRKELFRAACRMVVAKQRKCRFRTDDAEGQISTTLKTQLFVTFSGIGFTATVDTNRGSGSINYMVRHQDLIELSELAELSDDELIIESSRASDSPFSDN